MIPSLFLPGASPDLPDSLDDPIAHLRASAPWRDPRDLRRRHHDLQAASARGFIVEHHGVVGAVRRHTRYRVGHRPDEITARPCIVGCRLGQRLRDDPTGVVHSEMELLPTPLPAPAVFGGELQMVSGLRDDRWAPLLSDANALLKNVNYCYVLRDLVGDLTAEILDVSET